MTAGGRGSLVPLPAARGNMACVGYSVEIVERDEIARIAKSKRRQQERRRKALARRRACFILSMLIVAGIMAGFMPWDGTSPPPVEAAQEAAQIPAATLPALPRPSVQYEAETTTQTPAPAPFVPDAAEVEALAKMLWGEARGIASDTEKAACVWVVLNRVDDPRFHDTVLEVLEAPYQFAGYSPDYPATDELKALAADVLIRYHAEKNGDPDAGRVLPVGYCWFTGDGAHNHFVNEWRGTDVWGWTLESPYKN